MNLFKWFKRNKAVPNYRKDMDKVWEDNALDLGRISAFGKVNKRNKEKEYPYNIEFGDGRTKKEMDKMQKELLDELEIDGC
jgi:hypothetical protein